MSLTCCIRPSSSESAATKAARPSERPRVPRWTLIAWRLDRQQQRGRLLPRTFATVVRADQGNSAGGLPGPADDRAQHVGELGAGQQQPLGIRLGKDDPQEGDKLTGAWQPILDQAVVAEFQWLLDTDADGPQSLTTAQFQKARSSSSPRSRRFLVCETMIQVLPAVPCGTTARTSC